MDSPQPTKPEAGIGSIKACSKGSASQGTPGAWASKRHNPYLSWVPPVLPPPPALRQPPGFKISPGSKGPSTKTRYVPDGAKVGHASNSHLCASTLPEVFLAALCFWQCKVQVVTGAPSLKDSWVKLLFLVPEQRSTGEEGNEADFLKVTGVVDRWCLAPLHK